MNNDAARDVIKGYLPDYMAELGLPTDSKFTCLSGCFSTEDAYPTMSYYPGHTNGPCVRCFRCGCTLDIFDLAGMYEHIDGYIPQLRFLAEKFGVVLDDGCQSKKAGVPKDSNPGKSVLKEESALEDTSLAPVDVVVLSDNKSMDDWKKGQQQKERRMKVIAGSASGKLVAAEYLMTRGIDGKCVDDFNIGSVPDYYDAVTQSRWQALVIPLALDTAVIRNLDTGADPKNRYRKLGPSGVWNRQALYEGVKAGRCVVVTEGEIDALSVISAGGLAVALGGINTDILVNELDSVKKKTGKFPTLVIALDTDAPGKEAQRSLLQAVKAKKVDCYVLPELHSGCKDLNERLVQDREAFFALIGSIQGPNCLESYLYDKDGQNSMYLSVLLDEIARCNTDADKKVSTGFAALDALLDGGISYGLYVLGALPSVGKTTFALQMVDNLARQGHHVLFYTLDNTRDELIAKSISRLTYEIVIASGYDRLTAKTANDFLAGSKYRHYSELELQVIKEATASYSEFGKNIYMYNDLPSVSPTAIEEHVIRHMRLKKKKPMVVVDFMQMIKVDQKADDKKNVDLVLSQLKAIAKKYSVPVLGISTLNRENYYNAAKVSALKASGDNEYFANYVIMLEYTGTGQDKFDFDKACEENPSKVDLVLLKNKMGIKQKRIHMLHYLKYSKFEELKDGYEETAKPVHVDSRLKNLKKY